MEFKTTVISLSTTFKTRDTGMKMIKQIIEIMLKQEARVVTTGTDQLTLQ